MRPSQALQRCDWCKEWGRPQETPFCAKCGEVYVPVPNAGPPRYTTPESCVKTVDP
jgi:hypothetical protein